MAISKADFDARRAELQRGIALAQDEYASASLKELTGAGTDADVDAAKVHLDALRGKLSDLDAAQKAAEADLAAELAGIKQQSFASAVDRVEAALTIRRDAVEVVEKAAADLCAALNAYADAGREIVRIAGSAASGRSAGELKNRIFGVEQAVNPNAWTAPILAASIFAENRVQVASGGQRRAEAFAGGDALAFENLRAGKVRAAFQTLAPASEA
ncbi:hypothetical protein [Novosphingobium sp.]|uniref:hypothetical protein n=1 Tax=Novosphingobium sp. TaxID=1874826 RepID=UPI002FDD5D90